MKFLEPACTLLEDNSSECSYNPCRSSDIYDGELYCKCPPGRLGLHCQINAEELLPVPIVLLAAVIILTVCVCAPALLRILKNRPSDQKGRRQSGGGAPMGELTEDLLI